MVYNSFTFRKIIYDRNKDLDLLIEMLENPVNMYCIELTEENINNEIVKDFIKSIRESFSGDIVFSKPTQKKPIMLYPIQNLQRQVERIEQSYENLGKNILNYLHEITIYLTGECDFFCAHCDVLKNQLTYCTKSHFELSFPLLVNFINQISHSNLKTINFIGGNIFKYSELENLMNVLNTSYIKKNLYVSYLNMNIENISYFLNKYKCRIYILIDKVTKNFPNTIFNCQNKYVIENLYYLFIVSTENEYYYARLLINKYNLENAEIKPVFKNNNYKFFEKYVYLTNKDIDKICTSKKDIFMRQSLNLNDFGKLTITSDGKIFANINNNSLGTLKDDPKEIIYNEMKCGNSWLKIRNFQPCNNCINQWLCPSPTSYEFVLRKPNLCHIC
jgi:pseudo-rSAM protein